jgi:hypothetical protein
LSTENGLVTEIAQVASSSCDSLHELGLRRRMEAITPGLLLQKPIASVVVDMFVNQYSRGCGAMAGERAFPLTPFASKLEIITYGLFLSLS